MSQSPLRRRAAHIWHRQAADHYVEPEWVSARFFEMRNLTGTLLDPACGFGRIVRAANAAGLYAMGSDIEPRWQLDPAHDPEDEFRYAIADFLDGPWPPKARLWNTPDIIMSNPPFAHAQRFYDAAIARAGKRVVLLLPIARLCGIKTSAWLEKTPLRFVYPLGPRPSMPPGDYILAGKKPANGHTDYAWYEWELGYCGRPEIIPMRRGAS